MNAQSSPCGASDVTSAAFSELYGRPLGVALPTPPAARRTPPESVSIVPNRTPTNARASRLEGAGDALGKEGWGAFVAGGSLFCSALVVIRRCYLRLAF